jgi:hypothetical protein
VPWVFWTSLNCFNGKNYDLFFGFDCDLFWVDMTGGLLGLSVAGCSGYGNGVQFLGGNEGRFILLLVFYFGFKIKTICGGDAKG